MKHIKELDYILSSKKDMSILAQNELKNINTSESVIKNSYICHQITHVDDKIANLILGNKAIFETNFQKPNFSKVAYIIYLYEYFLINVVSVQDTLLHVINNIYGLNIKNHNVHYNKNFIKKIKNFPNIKSKLDEYNTYISGIDGYSEMKGMQNKIKHEKNYFPENEFWLEARACEIHNDVKYSRKYPQEVIDRNLAAFTHSLCDDNKIIISESIKYVNDILKIIEDDIF